MVFFLGFSRTISTICKAVCRDQVGISRVPNRTGCRGRLIQVHSYTLFLRTLAGEGVGSSRLRHLRSAFEKLFSTLVDSGNTDDKFAILHTGMFDFDCKLISGENHSDEIDIVAVDTNEFTIDYQKLNSLEHAIRNALSYDSLHICLVAVLVNMPCVRINGARQGGKGGKVGVRVNGVEVTGDV
jgi:hypothetical protein